MSSLGWSSNGVSGMKRACACRTPQAGIVSQISAPDASRQLLPMVALRCSTIASADSSRRREPGYDAARNGSGRATYNEATLDEFASEYDMPVSRSRSGAQAGLRGGQAPFTQGGRAQQAYPAPGQPGAPATYLEDSRSRQNNIPSGQAAQLDYQEAPQSYALQRAPQAPMQLSFVEALKGKDVISAAEGARLGVAAGAILDASAMTLEAITLSDTVVATARGEPPLCVPTATLTQVGDVILVTEERAMRRPPAVAEFVPVIGLHVRTSRGVYIGRVNDVDFEPETGAVAAVYYDEYGLDWLPPGVVNLFRVPTDAVLSVTRDTVVVDSRFTSLAAPGRFESVGKALKSLRIVGGERDSATAVGARQARSLQAWEAQYGMTAEEWLERYGGPAVREEARPALPRGRRGDPRRRSPTGRDARLAVPPTQGAQAPPRRAAQPAAPRQRPAPSGRQRGQPGEYSDAEGDEWGAPALRPAFGDVLERDGRALEYDELQRPLSTKRRGDAMRGEDAF